MSGRRSDQYDPRYDRGDSDSFRIQLDRERAARIRRAVAFERKLFEATTRDLLPPKEPALPTGGGVIEVLPRERFTDDELERF